MNAALAPQNIGKTKLDLLNFLTENDIRFCEVLTEEMKEKAVVQFSFDEGLTPCILYGRFHDRIREVVSIAHEAGHVLTYKGMNRDETRTYLCAMLAVQGVGLKGISLNGQEFILSAEAKASSNGKKILETIGVGEDDIGVVTGMMARWYATYEALCEKEVVERVRERIIRDRKASFLFSLDHDETLPGYLDPHPTIWPQG
jgi:hypothetical protein